ncbi:hypothetical protein QJS10_CPA09g02049 [Acorus calamus]|uniref:Uncharacterized protein n=1 Tax=Acorus calamus TaxID=4465 RepID=A0AAV9E2H1_ACOCL|nr:hypothetical protein QJS10_CPB21g00046 [Acorus calamus]KAK1307616.1 hypothetical protein QJS10_CPA09g02049 [Acorus calamus]
MPRLSLKKKLQPAKRVWRGLATALRRLKRSRPIKRTATQLQRALSSLTGRPYQSPKSHRFKYTYYPSVHSTPKFVIRSRKHRKHRLRSFKPVYVDDLFSKPSASTLHVEVFEEEKVKDGLGGCSSSSSSVTAAAEEVEVEAEGGVVALEGVDLRAEQFIASFREEMRLQRQRSFGEYKEMLARGV